MSSGAFPLVIGEVFFRIVCTAVITKILKRTGIQDIITYQQKASLGLLLTSLSAPIIYFVRALSLETISSVSQSFFACIGFTLYYFFSLSPCTGEKGWLVDMLTTLFSCRHTHIPHMPYTHTSHKHVPYMHTSHTAPHMQAHTHTSHTSYAYIPHHVYTYSTYKYI